MAKKKQEVWTRQCSDGRACGGLHNSPRFVPDDQDVCDDCLAAIYGLEPVYDSCSCGHYSEQTGFSTETVMAALRRGVKPRRFYFGIRVEWLDRDGNPLPPETLPRTGEYGHRSYAAVYDGEQPRPRTPIEERPWGDGNSSKWAYARVKVLNGE